jgi:hypothetical protein
MELPMSFANGELFLPYQPNWPGEGKTKIAQVGYLYMVLVDFIRIARTSLVNWSILCDRDKSGGVLIHVARFF